MSCKSLAHTKADSDQVREGARPSTALGQSTPHGRNGSGAISPRSASAAKIVDNRDKVLQTGPAQDPSSAL